MENALTKLLRCAGLVWETHQQKDVRDELEEVRLLFSWGPARVETVPPAWQDCLPPGDSLARSMADQLARCAGATPARYGLTTFHPEDDGWLTDLLIQLVHSRLSWLATGQHPGAEAPASPFGLTPYGAERLVTDWLVCVVQAGNPLQKALCPGGGDLYDYLAAATAALLINSQPTWFAMGVVPLRTALRDWLTDHLAEDLHNLVDRQKSSTRPVDPTYLTTLRCLTEQKLRAPLDQWLQTHAKHLEYRAVGKGAEDLVNLLLPPPSRGWSLDQLKEFPSVWLNAACQRCRQQMNARAKANPAAPEPLFAKALPASDADKWLPQLLAGQTPATNDTVVKLAGYLASLVRRALAEEGIRRQSVRALLARQEIPPRLAAGGADGTTPLGQLMQEEFFLPDAEEALTRALGGKAKLLQQWTDYLLTDPAVLAALLRAMEEAQPGQPTPLWEDLLGSLELGKHREPAQRRQSSMLRFVLLQLLGVNGSSPCYGGEKILREKCFRLGLALNLGADELEQTLLYPLDLPGLDYKNAWELICAYCADHCSLPACRWSLAQWGQKIYALRSPQFPGSEEPEVPPLRLTVYWRNQYQDWYGKTPGDLGKLLSWMYTEKIAIYQPDLFPAEDLPCAAVYLYGSARFRAGRMLLEVADTLVSRWLAALRADLCELNDSLQQGAAPTKLLAQYQLGLALTRRVEDSWLQDLLVAGMLPWFPTEEILRRDLLKELLQRIQQGKLLTRTDLLQMGTIWYFVTQAGQKAGEQHLSLRQRMADLTEQLETLLRECRFPPYDPDRYDEAFDEQLQTLWETFAKTAP